MGKGYLASLALGVLSAAVFADTQYLVVGGGPVADHSQVVLERNVELFTEVGGAFAPGELEVLFGAGGSGENDVIEKVRAPGRAEALFADLVGDELLGHRLRRNRLTNVLGDATRASVENRLDEVAGRAPSHFRFYFTGHGSRSFFGQSYLNLWRDQDLWVPAFVAKLDRLPPETHTQVVMVQCFSGGFADMNYVGGVPAKGFSPANRCGFFAQLPERPAAGCSPDINDREEYSPYFFAALNGRHERGYAVDADYDRDGRVTADEAHAYVIVAENSFDVPISTSSHLLRQTGLKIPAEKDFWEVFDRKERPIEARVLDELQATLGVTLPRDGDAVAFVTDKLKELGIAVTKAAQRYKKAEADYKKGAGELLDAAKKYLEVEGVTAQAIGRLGKGESDPELDRIRDRTIDFIATHPVFVRAQDDWAHTERALKGYLDLLHVSAKWERIQYLMDTVLLEEALLADGEDAIREKYRQLKECEHQPFFGVSGMRTSAGESLP